MLTPLRVGYYCIVDSKLRFLSYGKSGFRFHLRGMLIAYSLLKVPDTKCRIMYSPLETDQSGRDRTDGAL